MRTCHDKASKLDFRNNIKYMIYLEGQEFLQKVKSRLPEDMQLPKSLRPFEDEVKQKTGIEEKRQRRKDLIAAREIQSEEQTFCLPGTS